MNIVIVKVARTDQRVRNAVCSNERKQATKRIGKVVQ